MRQRRLDTVLVGAAACSAAAWAYLALLHGRFWRTDIRLPPTTRGEQTWPDVAVLVPARDEAAVLPRTLPSLLAQRYAGRFSVILIDDCSSDGTADVARALDGDGVLSVLTGTGTPPGWAGKVWALEQGRRAAGTTAYLLLTDADIAHAPDSLARLVSLALRENRDLVSVMARLHTESAWERLLVPAFVYFFAQLYPFRRVATSSRTAAAAGGCILVRTAALDRAGGLAALRDALIDDVTLARLVKHSGGRLWLGLFEDVRSVRAYPRLSDLWDMVARSAFVQLRHSWLLLAGTVGGLLLVYAVPPAALATGLARRNRSLVLLGGAAWLTMSATYAPMLREYGQPRARGALLPVTAALYATMTVDSAIRHARGSGVAWKGRAPGRRGRIR